MKKIILRACFYFCILGSFAVANEASSEDASPKPITRKQFLMTQTALFNKADANYDGKVTKEEVLLLKWERDKPKYKTAFAKLDINNNGFLSYDEVKTKHEELTQNKVERDLGQRGRLLKKHDTDGDGKITPKELDDYYAKLAKKTKASTEKNAQKDFQAKDKDESNLITLDEYLVSKSGIHALKSQNKEQETRFLTRDSSKDGIITRPENELFATRLFGVLDKNKDDIVSDSEQSNRVYRSSHSFNAGVIFLNPR